MYTSFSTIALVAAFLSTANAAVINMYSDSNCQNYVGNRNVWDNTCAATGGFQSYMITTEGGDNQQISTYSPNNCSGSYLSCNGARSTGVCYASYNSAGGSNAISSSTSCGVA
ncbi:hypothetical protein N431DRAFT_474103 [Stipitochalara longipes BDJ]|nr:hypothetical protein N431DRAFT_474103 [Stipitochalara longipes BDJ]